MINIFASQSLLGAARCFCRKIACLLMLVSVTGCYVTYRGYYTAIRPEGGWSHSMRNGNNFFRYPTKGMPDWYIQIGGAPKTVCLRIGSDAYDPGKVWEFIRFPNDEPIRIIFHDKNEQITLPSCNFHLPYGQDFYVGDSRDFTVITPPFKIGANRVPSLSAHVRWSDGKYRVWVPLQ